MQLDENTTCSVQPILDTLPVVFIHLTTETLTSHNMDKNAIEAEARRLQYEIWTRRDVRYQFGVPGIPTLFDPRNVADHCGLYFDVRDKLDTDYLGGGEAAGLWQRDRFTILVSRKYPFEVQRFTAGHEIGHFILHPQVGDRTLHRELPLIDSRIIRPPLEQEADYFSACLLMPRKAVISEFDARFSSRHPLVLTETSAYHLKIDLGTLFSQPRGSLLFAQAVARAEQYDRQRFVSLQQYFGVSVRAMAIRLNELDLVAPYLHN
jgi:Zn-dependent peptidase ImmA (M78 family)